MVQAQEGGTAQGLMVGLDGSVKVDRGRMSQGRVWVVFWMHILGGRRSGRRE